MAVQNDDVVKSVGRVFEVLELFDRSKEGLNASEVERTLDYPQSSTLALLKSMVKLGYLSFDRIEKTYFPTMRVAMLGKWVESSAYGDNRLPALLDDISEATGETVSLSSQNDLDMQFLQIRAGRNPLTLNIQAGDRAPLFESTIGLTALSDKTDAEIGKFAERLNRRIRRPENKIALPRVIEQINTIRQAGYGVGYNTYIHSIGAVAWLLPPRSGGRSIVLSVAGPSDSIREKTEAIVKAVRAALKAHA